MEHAAARPHRKVHKPHANAPGGTCRWCGLAITDLDTGLRNRRRRWHKGLLGEPDCLGIYLILSDHRHARRYLTEKQHGHCARCDGYRPLEVDHVWPLIDGGPHTLENLQGLCHECHRWKTSEEARRRARARARARHRRQPPLPGLEPAGRRVRV